MRPRWMIVHKIVLATVLPVLKLLPYLVAHRLLRLFGRLDLIVLPGQRRLYEDAVSSAKRRLGRDWDVRLLSRALARQTYCWRTRDLLLGSFTDRGFEELFRVTGREHLDAALAAKKGVILLANHFGSHVLISHWMFRNGYQIRWFGERPRNVSQFLKAKLESDGPLGQAGLYISRRTPMTEAASMIVRLARILKEGMIVKVACDVRWRGGKIARADFLGQSDTFTSAWVHLAARTSAAVVLVFCRLDEAGIYHLEFQSPFQVPTDAARNGQDAGWVQKALEAVEVQVGLHPDASNDYFFWSPTDAGMPVAGPTPTHRGAISAPLRRAYDSDPYSSSAAR